ncbi:hypothetical protein [Bradyrhizobium sp. CCBAU 51627]|uniref:hypothetical protein n=1 Tax=Bradyrhizobium sp. CCBAU 51627 TaxID=1325088 RepID=UPI0023050991|nr:hypothetical protein [Bradyrhizobium sp. CCBAU 51627]
MAAISRRKIEAASFKLLIEEEDKLTHDQLEFAENARRSESGSHPSATKLARQFC